MGTTIVTRQEAGAALARAVTLSGQIRRHEQAVVTAKEERRRCELVASRGGITYEEIAARCAVSVAGVWKDIRRARAEHPDLSDALPPGRRVA